MIRPHRVGQAAIATGAPSVAGRTQTTLTPRATTSRATVAARSLDECSAATLQRTWSCDPHAPVANATKTIAAPGAVHRPDPAATSAPRSPILRSVVAIAIGHDLAGQDRRKRWHGSGFPSSRASRLQRGIVGDDGGMTVEA